MYYDVFKYPHQAWVENHLTFGQLRRIVGELPVDAVLYSYAKDYYPVLDDSKVFEGFLGVGSVTLGHSLKEGLEPVTAGSLAEGLYGLDDLIRPSYVWLDVEGSSDYHRAVNGVRINGDGSYTLSSVLTKP